MTNDNIGWDDALKGSGKFVSLKSDESKVLVLTNWRFEENPKDSKVAAGQIAFKADVTEEDGEPCEKTFDTASNRLKKKLRPIFEGKPATEKVKISILRVGDRFDVQYSVKQLQLK